MENLIVNAVKRDVVGKKVKQLRREGLIPGVIYGSNIEPMNITMNLHETSKALSKATGSSLITIKVEGEKNVVVLLRETQKNFIRNEYIHIDFQAVSMTETIRAEVPVVTQGSSLAVKDHSAVLVNGLTSISVVALPNDLPDKFVVDLGALNNIGDTILVRDLVAPENVEILSVPEDMIVTAIGKSAGLEAEVEGEELAETDGSEPEVIEKGKKEEDEE